MTNKELLKLILKDKYIDISNLNYSDIHYIIIKLGLIFNFKYNPISSWTGNVRQGGYIFYDKIGRFADYIYYDSKKRTLRLSYKYNKGKIKLPEFNEYLKLLDEEYNLKELLTHVKK